MEQDQRAVVCLIGLFQPGKCLIFFTEACEDQSNGVRQVRALLRRPLERLQQLARFGSTTGLGVC